MYGRQSGRQVQSLNSSIDIGNYYQPQPPVRINAYQSSSGLQTVDKQNLDIMIGQRQSPAGPFANKITDSPYNSKVQPPPYGTGMSINPINLQVQANQTGMRGGGVLQNTASRILST